jgi:TolB-like protein
MGKKSFLEVERLFHKMSPPLLLVLQIRLTQLKNLIPIMILFFLTSGCAVDKKGIKTSEQSRIPPISLENGIDKLTKDITESLPIEKKLKIAVVDLLGPNDIHTQLGSFVSEKLITKLYKSRRFEKVLERKLLNDLLVQQRIEMEGYFDQDTVKSVVGTIGIDALLMGFITEYGSKVDLNVRLIDTSGQILSVAEVQVDKDDTVKRMIQIVKEATLTVAIHPPHADASVSVGGRRAKANNGISLFSNLPQGATSILVTAKGYEVVQESVYLTNDQTITISLPPKQCSLSVRVTPHHSEILLDGKSMGYASDGLMVLKGVTSATHTILARAEGYLSQRKVTEVDSDTTVSLNLVPDPLAELAKLTQEKPSFRVQIWTEKKVYKVGETIRFNFRSDQDCYLTLVDYEPNRNVKILFPNRYRQNNFIEGRKTYSIPGSDYGFKLIVEPPLGVEKVKAIATTEPLSLFELDFSKNFFPTVERSNLRTMRGISIVMDTLKKVSWSENTCSIRIQ